MITVLIKRTDVSQKQPNPEQLAFGQLALNYKDGKLFYKNSDGSIQAIGTNFGYVTSSQVDQTYAKKSDVVNVQLLRY